MSQSREGPEVIDLAELINANIILRGQYMIFVIRVKLGMTRVYAGLLVQRLETPVQASASSPRETTIA